MTIPVINYLGCSLVSCNAQMGWGGNPSQVNVTLVEDLAAGNLFLQPEPGEPTLFNVAGLNIAGIIQSWKYRQSTAGFLYEVNITDPREVLSSTQLILNNYAGNVGGVPNLINVYCYIENNTGFGSSLANEAGMGWKKIRDAVTTLTASTTIGPYGGPIHLKSHKYGLDISALPVLPDDFRIGSDSIS